MLGRRTPCWPSTHKVPSVPAEVLKKRWEAIVENGLGDDWTEEKGHESLRELLGPSE